VGNTGRVWVVWGYFEWYSGTLGGMGESGWYMESGGEPGSVSLCGVLVLLQIWDFL
jgi:hypothetical protein